ncbi:MAG: cold shock domain-containing protein, partial [Acidimicrobiia bacterium]|nr:cold shock domain-containing protein [Acidimicrobiia bacterium]
TDDGVPNLSDSETITVTVGEANVAPAVPPDDVTPPPPPPPSVPGPPPVFEVVPPPPVELTVEDIPTSIAEEDARPAGASASASRKGDVILALDDFEPGIETPQREPVTRMLVTMGWVSVAAVKSLSLPVLFLLILGLTVATVGNVTLFPLIGRSRRRAGTVIRFDDRSEYGFILSDDNRSEVFVHARTLRRRARGLATGHRVSYRIVKGSHRDFALGVRRIAS